MLNPARPLLAVGHDEHPSVVHIMSIKALPEDVISQIKSSITITSLNGVVDGLVRNCLDAGAVHIGVSVDYGRGNCAVEDDGVGIQPEEFRDGGGIGKLHREGIYP